MGKSNSGWPNGCSKDDNDTADSRNRPVSAAVSILNSDELALWRALFCCLLSGWLWSNSWPGAAAAAEPLKVLFDTDIDGDNDDVAAAQRSCMPWPIGAKWKSWRWVLFHYVRTVRQASMAFEAYFAAEKRAPVRRRQAALC